jgi:hypothetical protein
MTQHRNFPLLARNWAACGNDTAVHRASRLAARHTSADDSFRSAVILTAALLETARGKEALLITQYVWGGGGGGICSYCKFNNCASQLYNIRHTHTHTNIQPEKLTLLSQK